MMTLFTSYVVIYLGQIFYFLYLLSMSHVKQFSTVYLNCIWYQLFYGHVIDSCVVLYCGNISFLLNAKGVIDTYFGTDSWVCLKIEK